MAANNNTSMPSQGNLLSYADRDLRITKENLYMVLALWMEMFPLGSDEANSDGSFKKVGAVLVLPNDMIYAVDCSRNGVHGVARLLMAHPDVLQDCKVFVSRKPCSLCTKLLVQSQIKRVFYFPIEPEYIDRKDREAEMQRVDSLFKVSPIGQTVFVPRAGKEVLANTEKKYPDTPQNIRDQIKERLMNAYWSENWKKKARIDLPWPAFDTNMEEQVTDDFDGMMEWMATILVGSEKGYKFKAHSKISSQYKDLQFNPEENPDDGRQASRLITLAKFLAERTDDPRKGVGAVIMNEEREIVALGWNGFPTKALYGEFPRASDKDKYLQQKKYPYIIHAEQNALLMRNTKKIKGTTLFVTKTPCNDCTLLIEMLGITTFVLGEKMQKGNKEDASGEINYTKFADKVESNVFICFEMESGSIPATKKRDLSNI